MSTTSRRSGRYSRSKGLAGEREFAALWRAAGFEVRGLERGGDLTIVGHGHHLHGESKRQERPQVPVWIRQCERDCPKDVPWVLGFRASKQPWSAVMRIEPLSELTDGPALLAMLYAGTARSFEVDARMYTRMPLEALIGLLAS